MAKKRIPNKLRITLTEAMLFQAEKNTITIEQEIRKLKDGGMSESAIRELLLQDLVSDESTLFGQFKNAMREEIAGTMAQAFEQGVAEVFQAELGGEIDCRWTTVGDDDVCEDCDPRAGMVRSLTEWRAIGLPKSGFSRCDRRCRCEISPTAAGAPDRIE